MKKLPATVILLGSVSLLNDVAADMITPLLPIFLVSLGAGPAIIGAIEGVAEATVSLLKLWAGRLGDRGADYKRLTIMGYALSNLVRPLLGLATSWGMVMLVRFSDRIGKGLRSAPRDAMLSGAVDGAIRGQAFGLHRGMDHMGAVIGPLIASGLLALGLGMQQVFLASIVPGVLAVALLVIGLRAPAREPQGLLVPPLRWALLHPRLRALVLTAGALALVMVPDVFILLWLGLHVSPFWIPILWALAHLMRSLTAMPAGRLSDRYGRLPVLVGGWSLQIVLLLFVPWADNLAAVIVLLVFYAAASVSTEGAELALIGDFADPRAKGTAFGLYHMIVGLLALPGALWFGVVWEKFGIGYAFTISACLMALIVTTLIFVLRNARAH